MKIHPTKPAFLLLLLMVFLPACGVFEVGFEQPTPQQALATPLPPTAILPTPTKTPFPGQLKPGQAIRIIQINMLNITNGWGIGQVETDLNDHVLYTNDGGRSWQDVTPPDALISPPAQGLSATAFFYADGGAWVTYASQSPQPLDAKTQKLWHSTDNGQTWQNGGEITLTGFQMDVFLPFQLGFLDEQHGWLIAHTGAGMSHDYIAAFTTADGGKTWQRIIDAESQSGLMLCTKTAMAFSTATNGWLMGNCPGLMTELFFYFTTNGGQTWQPGSLFPPIGQPADIFSGNKAGCGIPDLIYLTARSMMLTLRCNYYDNDQNTAWLYTGKAGVVLESRKLPLPFGAIQFLNADEGWMIGSLQNDPSAPGEIYHTTDGGKTWTKLISTTWQGTPDFVNSSAGWVVARTGEKVALVFSSDGGVTWEVLSPFIVQ